MKKIFVFFLIFCTAILNAHTAWVDFELEKGLLIKIGGGHSFPASEQLIAERIINHLYLKTPAGKVLHVSTTEKNNIREAVLETTERGTFLICGGLRNPPNYFIKAVVNTPGNIDGASLVCGDRFEIIPLQNPGSVSKGEKIGLKVVFEGRPVETSLELSIAGGRNTATFTNKNGEFFIPVRTGGKYLITANYRGITATLVMRL